MERAVQFANRLFAARNLTAKAYLSSLATTLDFATRFVVGFVVTPLLVAGLGDTVFGIWKVLQRMTNYLTVTSGRSPQALKWFIASKQHSGDDLEKRQAVGGAVAVWLLLLPLQVVLAVAVTWFLPIWLSVPTEMTWSVRLAAALAAGGLIVSGLLENSRGILEGENLAYKRMLLSPALVVLSGALAVLALHWGLGLVGVEAAGLITTIVTGLSFVWVAKVHVPWFGVAIPDRDTVVRFFRLSWQFIAWHLLIRLMLASDVVILGLLATSELVTVYTLTRYLPEALFRFVSNVLFQTTPGLGGIIGRGDLKRAARVRGEVILLSWLAIAILGATLLLWNDAFLTLWVGEQYDAGWLPTLLIVIMVGQFTLIRYDGNIIDLSLDLRWKVLLGAIATVLSLTLAALFIGWFQAGIVGLCLGFICGRAPLSVGYPLIVGRTLQISWGSQLLASVRPTLVGLTLLTLCWLVRDRLQVHSWLSFILSVLLTVLVLGMTAYYAGLTMGQRAQLARRAGKVLEH